MFNEVATTVNSLYESDPTELDATLQPTTPLLTKSAHTTGYSKADQGRRVPSLLRAVP